MNDPIDEIYWASDDAWEEFLVENPSLWQIWPCVKYIRRDLRGLVLDSYHAGLRTALSMIASMPETSQKKVRP